MENALSSLAIDLSHDGISLHRLESGTWIALDQIPLQVGTLKTNMSRLRDMADSTDGKVLVWMPMEQIHVLPIQIAGLSDTEQQKTIQNAFVETGAFHSDTLEFHTGQMDNTGLSPVAAIETGVLTEAREFLADHGFEATAFSTRTAMDDFGGKPLFSQTKRGFFINSEVLAAAAGIALAVGFGGVVWNSLDLFRSANSPDFDIVTGLTAPDQERAPTLVSDLNTGAVSPDTSNTDTPVTKPALENDFAAFYAFPEDQNSIQVSIPPVETTEDFSRDDVLPGPDAEVTAPAEIAALNPGQSGDTIPNIFTSLLVENIDPLVEPASTEPLEMQYV